jgi:hypothetical protein
MRSQSVIIDNRISFKDTVRSNRQCHLLHALRFHNARSARRPARMVSLPRRTVPIFRTGGSISSLSSYRKRACRISVARTPQFLTSIFGRSIYVDRLHRSNWRFGRERRQTLRPVISGSKFQPLRLEPRQELPNFAYRSDVDKLLTALEVGSNLKW